MADFDWTEAMAKIEGGKSVTVKLPPPKPVSKTPPQVKSGTTWEWPDDMSQFVPNQEQSKNTDKVNPRRTAKEFGAGVVDTAGFLADSLPTIVTGNPALGRLIQHMMRTQPSEMLGTSYRDVVGPSEIPEGTADKYAGSVARNVGRFAVPVVGIEGNAGRALAEMLGGGVGAGLAGEFAAENSPEGIDPETSRMVGEFVGGGAGALGGGRVVRSEENRMNILRGANHPNYGSLIDTITDLEGGGTLRNPKTSPKGAMGVMQVMPDTARKPGFGIRPWNGKTQEDLARVGRQYAAALNGKYAGDEAKVLAAYNAGPGRVDGLVARYGHDWWKHLPDETKKYLQNGLNKLDGVNRGRGVRPMSPDEIASATGDNVSTLPEDSVAPADGQISGYDTMPEEAYLLNKALEPNDNVVDFNQAHFDKRVKDVGYQRAVQEAMGDEIPDVITQRELQDMPAAMREKYLRENPGTDPLAEGVPPIDNYHEKFTPYVDTENLSAANDPSTYKINPDDLFIEKEGANHYGITYHHPSGAKITADLVMKGDGVADVDIGGLNTDSNILGPGMVRKLIRAVQSKIPELKTINAERITGARQENPKYTTINLKDILNDEEGAFHPFGRDKGPKESSNSETRYEDLSPVEKLLKGVKETKPASAERRRAIHEARQRQAAILETMQKQGAGYKEQLASIKGQIPGADFESIAQHFKPEDVSHLEQLINESPRLRKFEKLSTLRSLHNLLDPEGLKMPTERELRNLSDVLGPSVWSDIAKRTKLDGPADVLFKTLNIPKTAQASIDVSGASRQAFPFVTRKEFWNSLPAYFKAYADRVIKGKDAKAYDKYMESIKDMDTYPEMKQAGVSFTGRGFSFSPEDYYQGSYAEAIPGYGTRLIKGSDEGYSGYLNLVRAKVFDTLYKQKIASGGVWTRDQLRELGEYVNTGTGRGGIFKFLRSSKKLLDTAFWSTSLQASRMKLLSPHYAARLYVKDPFLFKQYTRDMAGMIAVSAGMLSAAKLMFPGVTIETDPRSTDFLKIKVGNRRYDVLGSFQPYLRLAVQELTGEKKNVNTEEIKPLGSNPLGMLIGQDQTDHYPGFGDETRMTVLGNFFGNKLAPLPSLFLRYMEQNKYQKLDWPAEAAKLGVPMWLPDVYNETKTNGAASGAEILAPNFIGWGVQDYDPPKPKTSTGDDPFAKAGFDSVGGFDQDPFVGTGF